jgi:hypothetical protein
MMHCALGGLVHRLSSLVSYKFKPHAEPETLPNNAESAMIPIQSPPHGPPKDRHALLANLDLSNLQL